MTALPLESSRPPTRPKQWHWACADGLTHHLPSAGQQYAIKNPISEHWTSCCFVIHLEDTHELWWSKPKLQAQLVLSREKYRYHSLEFNYKFIFISSLKRVKLLISTFFNCALNYVKYTFLLHTNSFWIQVQYLQLKRTGFSPFPTHSSLTFF